MRWGEGCGLLRWQRLQAHSRPRIQVLAGVCVCVCVCLNVAVLVGMVVGADGGLDVRAMGLADGSERQS